MNILDSSAILAAMLQEEGSSRVDDLIDDSVVLSVNASEVVAKLLDKGLDDQEVRVRYHTLRLDVVPFDENLALTAGLLRSATRHKGLSLGDRACLALAIRENATVVTADRGWADLDIGCQIEVIR